MRGVPPQPRRLPRRARRDAVGDAASRRPMAERLVLVGMMGAGKTTVGRLLRRSGSGGSTLDSDAQVVRRHRPHRSRAVRRGRARRSSAPEESRVLSEALSGDRSVVVSAAGGVVLSEANRELLRALGDGGLAARRTSAPWPTGWARARGAHSSTPTRPSRSPPSTRCAAPSTRRSPTRWWTSTRSTPERGGRPGARRAGAR